MKRKWARSYSPHIQFKGGKIYYEYATLHFIFSLATKFQELLLSDEWELQWQINKTEELFHKLNDGQVKKQLVGV